MNSGHFYRYHQAYYFGQQRFLTVTFRFCLLVFSIYPSDKNESVMLVRFGPLFQLMHLKPFLYFCNVTLMFCFE
jgi:hypothetical protein